MTKPATVLAVALAATLLAACSTKKSSNAGIELRVTKDYGSQRLGDQASEGKPANNDTALSFLQRHHKVSVAGGQVRSIDNTASAGPRKWLVYVNGSAPSGSPGDYKLNPGDVVQWDYHDTTATPRGVPAIVGAYPEPFVHGTGGRKLPARVECADPKSTACQMVEDQLAKAGIIASSSTLGVSERGKILSVFVGPWSKLRDIHVARTLESGPAASGVFAKFTGGGTGLDLLDDKGQTVKSLGPGAGLVAASRFEATDAETGGVSVTWVVSGVDEAGTDAAAKLLDDARLRDAFAVAALPGGGDQRLPATR